MPYENANQICQQCAEKKTATHTEAEPTRALINDNLIHDLCENLQRANDRNDIVTQVNTLMPAINKVLEPAYLACSPCANTYDPYVDTCATCGKKTLMMKEASEMKAMIDGYK